MNPASEMIAKKIHGRKPPDFDLIPHPSMAYKILEAR
jgi:hypothetical protein